MIREGRCWVFGDDISTDLLYPQVAYTLPLPEAARLVFRANRPGWADLVREGDVLVGGRAFGSGSSRPATALLLELGIRAVVADSFSTLFFRNCVNFALPALECPGVSAALQEGETVRLDLASGLVEGLGTGVRLQARALPAELLRIVEDGGVLASLDARGLIDPVEGGR